MIIMVLHPQPANLRVPAGLKKNPVKLPASQAQPPNPHRRFPLHLLLQAWCPIWMSCSIRSSNVEGIWRNECEKSFQMLFPRTNSRKNPEESLGENTGSATHPHKDTTSNRNVKSSKIPAPLPQRSHLRFRNVLATIQEEVTHWNCRYTIPKSP